MERAHSSMSARLPSVFLVVAAAADDVDVDRVLLFFPARC